MKVYKHEPVSMCIFHNQNRVKGEITMKGASLVLLVFLTAVLMTSCTGRTAFVNDSQPIEGSTALQSQSSKMSQIPQSQPEDSRSTQGTQYPPQTDNSPSGSGIEQQSQKGTQPPTEAQTPAVSPSGTENTVPADKVYYSGRAVVLTYHHISTKPISGITIKPERFESDLRMLKESGFNVISFRDMINAINGEAKLPTNAVVITFDDGYESFYTYAYPLLRKYTMPATEFVITSWTEGLVELNKELGTLNPDEIREMYKSGLVDIQSHSHAGHNYIVKDNKGGEGGFLAYRIYDSKTNGYEDPESYRKRVFDDLLSSIPIIQKYTGVAPDTLCFPFGQYNSRLVEIAKEAGFKYFVTTQYGYNKENSKNIFIYRIRSGDAKLNSEKLKQNIIDCGKGIQPATP